ncbi:hypothetical protein L7F22_010530 [Adiantum nelumboides]|nr:hypothetical protein [Adiantum nelumboides]
MKVPPFLSTKDKIFKADEYTRDLDTAFAKVCETLQKSQERQKKVADRHRRDLKLKENDWVLLRFEKARLRKKKRNRGRLQYFQEGGMSQNGHVAAHGAESSDDVALFHNNAVASTDAYGNFALEVEKTLLQGPPAKKGFRRAADGSSGFAKFRFGVARVHSEGYESKKSRIWDPRDNKNLHRWNGLFVLSCLAALFIDPLFYYLPIVNSNVCLEIDKHLAIVITILRSITDIFYLIHMGLQFRTGYIVSSSRILGRGELVKNPGLIAKRYLKGQFFVDLVAVLPLPQIIIWAVIPALAGTTADNTKNALRLIILVQLIPRMYPLTQVGKSVSLVPETAWAGAAYNLLLYMLISHFFGACWYLLAVERQDTCWRSASKNVTNFRGQFLDCSYLGNIEREGWNRTIAQSLCSHDGDFFNYGIYQDALDHGIVSTKKFVIKYFYCLWWGLRNLR